LTSAWGVDARDQGSIWDNSKAYYKPMAMSLTRAWAARGLVHAGCWAHSRRKFFDAATLNPADAGAARMVKRTDELFGIDALAREEKLDQAARHVLRLERAQPLVAIIRAEVEAARDSSLPSSALGKAANYTLLQWPKLTRFLEHAELELSNNLAENSTRPVGFGPKELDPRR
jgi:transposase